MGDFEMNEAVKEIVGLREKLNNYMDSIASVRAELDSEKARADRAENAIRAHRDQRGHDRCHLDDDMLYAILPEGPQPPNGLPPREEFLAGCERFERLRRHPGAPIDSSASDPLTLLANAKDRIISLEKQLTQYRLVLGNPHEHPPTDALIAELSTMPKLSQMVRLAKYEAPVERKEYNRLRSQMAALHDALVPYARRSEAEEMFIDQRSGGTEHYDNLHRARRAIAATEAIRQSADANRRFPELDVSLEVDTTLGEILDETKGAYLDRIEALERLCWAMLWFRKAADQMLLAERGEQVNINLVSGDFMASSEAVIQAFVALTS